MAEQFKAGDVVRLKSGGPPMTVDGYNDLTGNVECSWFDGKKQLMGQFGEATLEKAQPGRPAIAFHKITPR